MKQITIKLYGIEELKPEAQEKAFESNRNTNVEDQNWYDCEFMEFERICKPLGISIPINGIAFRGFYSQGDGSTFTSLINLKQLFDGVANQSWKTVAPELEFDFTPCPCDKRVLALLKKGIIEHQLYTEKTTRVYSVDYKSEYYYSGSYANIEHELTKLDKWVRNVLDRLNKHLYESIQNEYEYQISDEAIKEQFISEHALFTEDGVRVDCLLKIVEES